MKVCEIFISIQGESTSAGLPCTFVRLSGCNLRCAYCDTKYAYEKGAEMSVDTILMNAEKAGINLVEITGGEPLLQKDDVQNLITGLLDKGRQVLIETNGSLSIEGIDKRAIIIMDIKTPSSGMSDKMDFNNLRLIKSADEIKFVICGRNDYEWSKNIVDEYKLAGKCNVLFSPAFKMIESSELAKWIIADRLNVRLNLQIHKYIFEDDERGSAHILA